MNLRPKFRKLKTFDVKQTKNFESPPVFSNMKLPSLATPLMTEENTPSPKFKLRSNKVKNVKKKLSLFANLINYNKVIINTNKIEQRATIEEESIDDDIDMD